MAAPQAVVPLAALLNMYVSCAASSLLLAARREMAPRSLPTPRARRRSSVHHAIVTPWAHMRPASK
eukprot:2065065-Prymnesium_polylepis.1